MRGIAQFHDIVIDVEIDPAFGLPLEHDGIIARIFEVGAEEAIGLRRGGAIGHGAAGHHGEPTGAPGRQAGQRPGGQNQAILRVIPMHLRRHFFLQDLGANAHAAQIMTIVLQGSRAAVQMPFVGQIDT